MERETLTYIGIVGAARAQGADIEIPSVHDTKDEFDAWLISDTVERTTGDMLIKRALGLKEE